MYSLFTRSSSYKEDAYGFEGSKELKEMFNSAANILVVGAGGLGCEILKNLALSEVKSIYVIDLDTIELTNLNRQFLFRKEDIGDLKAKVASEYIKSRYEDIDIKWTNLKVQELSKSFFKQFSCIIGGLDNMEARLYINRLVHELVEFDVNGKIKEESIIPYIDGGTEGFRGQSRVIIPYKTSCLSCTKDLTAKRNVYALCTIAERPRLPEHCVEYISIVEWKKHYERAIDTDSIEDIKWVCDKAIERANKFEIKGVDLSLTLGVLKNIIPAIASTNALIAAETVLEAIKVLTGVSKILDNNFMYMGHEGVFSSHDKYERNENCYICRHPLIVKARKNDNIDYIIKSIITINPDLESPLINRGFHTIYDSKNQQHTEEGRLYWSLIDIKNKGYLDKVNFTEAENISFEIIDSFLDEPMFLKIVVINE